MIQEPDTTLWCGNLSEQVTEEILYELFLQAGPLEKVVIPKDRDGRQKSFAFVTFCHAVSVPYAINLFRGTALFSKTLNLQSRGHMALLPPPIRCYGPEPPIQFAQTVPQQFADMTVNLQNDDLRNVLSARPSHDTNDKLVLASLQGNWTHRHHPYRPKEVHRDVKPHREDERYRLKDNVDYKNNRNASTYWRNRNNKNNRRRSYHKHD